MIDFGTLRERKLREADALGAVDVRNVRPSSRDFAYFVATDRQEITICPEFFRRDPYGAPVPAAPDLESLVRESEEVGALAFGVATDGEIHGGSEGDLSLVAKASGVPVLRVDYLVRENQLFRTRLLGADSAILHASLLDTRAIAHLLDVGRHMRMECVVEAVDAAGIATALEAGARIVSVDARGEAGAAGAARDDALDRLLSLVPRGLILLVHGGVATSDEVNALRGRTDGVLIGAPFLSAPDPADFLAVLIES